MTAKDLRKLIEETHDDGAPGLTRAAPSYQLLDAWRAARDEATSAYESWRRLRSKAAFAVYCAAEDRADAAVAALRAATTR
jgi:hypothetical protein